MKILRISFLGKEKKISVLGVFQDYAFLCSFGPSTLTHLPYRAVLISINNIHLMSERVFI